MRRMNRFFCMVFSFFMLCVGFTSTTSFESLAAVERIEAGDDESMQIGDIVDYRGKKYIVYKKVEGEVYLQSLTGARRACDHVFEFSNSDLIVIKISGSKTYCFQSRYKNYFICSNCDALNIRYSPYEKEPHDFFGGTCNNVVNDKWCTAKE